MTLQRTSKPILLTGIISSVIIASLVLLILYKPMMADISHSQTLVSSYTLPKPTLEIHWENKDAIVINFLKGNNVTVATELSGYPMYYLNKDGILDTNPAFNPSITDKPDSPIIFKSTVEAKVAGIKNESQLANQPVCFYKNYTKFTCLTTEQIFALVEKSMRENQTK